MDKLKIRDNSLLWWYYDNVLNTYFGMRRYGLNLCGFAQRLFWGSVILAILIGSVLFVVWSLLYVPYYLIRYGLHATYQLFHTKETLGFQFLMPVGIAFWILILIVVIAALISKLIDVAIERKRNKIYTMRIETQLTAKNIFWAWLKAKKTKVCPMIEVVHEKTATE